MNTIELPDLAKPYEQQLRELMRVFLEENSKLNLSALRTEESCWIGNILDSLSILDILPRLTAHRSSLATLDLGTGGGFPLFPLAICLPEGEFTGLDATQKKIEAISRIAGALDLPNVYPLSGRAESLGHDEKYREQFDLVTSRAVAPLNVLLEYCSPFAKPGGYVVLWKSLHIDDELKDSLLARSEFSCHLELHHHYSLGENYGERQLLVFKKASRLNKKYPRIIGAPKKNPIQ